MAQIKKGVKKGIRFVIASSVALTPLTYATSYSVTGVDTPKTLNASGNDTLNVSTTGSITVLNNTTTPPVTINHNGAGGGTGNVTVSNSGTLNTSQVVAPAALPVIRVPNTTNQPFIMILNNNGTIQSAAAANLAIDMSAANTGTGSVTINHGGGTITGGVTFPTAVGIIPTFNVATGAQLQGSITASNNNGAFNANGDFTLPAGFNLTNIGAINANSGIFTIAGGISTTGNMLVNSGATAVVTGSVALNGANNTITNNGILTVTGGSINAPITGSNTSTLNMNNYTPDNTIANVANINVTGGSVTFRQNNAPIGPSPISTVPTGFSRFTIATGATVNFASGGSAPVPSLVIPNGATFTNDGALSMNGNAMTVGSGATLDLNNFTTSGAIAPSSGNYTLNVKKGTFVVSAGSVPTGFNSLNIDGATTNMTLNAPLSINGATLKLSGGNNSQTITANNNAITGNANSVFLQDSTFSGTYTPSGDMTNIGTFNINGGTFVKNAKTISGFTNFNIGGGTLLINTALDIGAASLTLNSGAINFDPALVGAGLTGTAGSTLTIGANFTPTNGISGIRTIAINAGTTTLSAASIPSNFTTLTVGASGTLTTNADFTIPANATLSVAGTYNMNTKNLIGNANATLTLQKDFTLNGSITGVPTINVNVGTFLLNGKNVTGATTFTIANGATATLDAGSNLQATSVANNGTLNVANGTLTAPVVGGANSTLNVTAGTLTTNGNITAGNINVLNNGTSWTLNHDVTGFSAFTIGTGATTIVSSGRLLGLANATAPITHSGLLTVNGGTVNAVINGNAGSSIRLTNIGGTNPIVNGAISNVPTIQIANANTAFTTARSINNFTTFDIAASTSLIVSQNTSLTGIANAVVNNSGTLNMNGGSLTANIVGVAGSSLNVNSNYSTDGTISSVATIATFNNGTEFLVKNPISNFTSLTIGNASTLKLDPNGVLTPANGANITINGGGTLFLNGGTLAGSVISGGNNSAITVGKDFTLSSGLSLGTLAAPITTVNVVSPATFTVTGTLNTQNINIAANSSLLLNTDLTLPNSGSITSAGILNLNGRAINANAASNTTLTLNSDFNFNSTINNITSINLNLGNFTLTTMPTGFSTLSLAAPATATLNTDFVLPSAATFTTSGTFNMNNRVMTVGDLSSIVVGGPLITSGAISAVGNGSFTVAVNNGGVLSVNNPITGYSALSVAAGATLNLNENGRLLNSVTLSGGTFNYNGGNFTGNMTGTGTLNIANKFTPNGSVSLTNVNVNGNGVLTINTPLTVTNNLNINPNGIVNLNNTINGNVINSGALSMNVGTNPTIDVKTITGNYTHQGDLQVVLMDKKQFTQLHVTGNTTLNGGKISITLPNKGIHIANSDTFKVLDSDGLITNTSMPTVTYPSSAILSFTPFIEGQDLILLAHRRQLEDINDIPGLEGISNVLDKERNKDLQNAFSPIFTAMDEQIEEKDVENFLQSLIPEESRGGIVETGIINVALPMEQIIGEGGRTDQLRAGLDRLQTGYTAGDMAQGLGSYGPMFFGNATKQGTRGGMDGYQSTTTGVGLLADAPISEFVRLGVAVSYAGSTVKRSGLSKNLTHINSAQGMVYGSANYGPLFLDGLFSVGHNVYKGKRNIIQVSQTASSTYQGNQYAGKVRGGFIIPFFGIEASPIGHLQYMTLNRGGYTERGAPGANLIVNARQVSSAQLGLGVRVTETSQVEEFLPEIHVMCIHDINQPSLQVTSRFTEGGGSFVSDGPLPPKNGINAGASISALVSDDLMVTGSYDVDARKSYISHSASFKFRMLF